MTAAWQPQDPARMIDTSVAHPARRYNYWLGGKDHFAADRTSGDAITAVYPHTRTAALENRDFLHRAVTHLAQHCGIRQFLDIGTGIPVSPNTHEIAQQLAADSRVVYVDNDPIVLTHARALLTSSTAGAVAYLDQDLRDPAAILANPALSATLDLDQPVGLLLVAVLHFIADHEQPQHILRHLLDALAPGSYLVLSHATADLLDDKARVGLTRLAAADPTGFHLRSRDELAGWLTGLELLDPGLVSVVHWPDMHQERAQPKQASIYGAVARNP